MRCLLIFAVVVVCAFYRGFFVGAAEQPAVMQGPTKESSTSAHEQAGDTAREFLGFADVSEFRGVIDDPDGYVNLHKEKRADALVITKVKAGEPFQFKKKEGEEWCQVKLKSGVTGWMHYSRIKLYFMKDDLPAKSGEGDEVDEQAPAQGINYYEVTQAAAQGDNKALKTFLSFGGDGAAAEEHAAVSSVVIHLVGDNKLARFSDEQ